jgi:hypothetical protein
MFDQNQSPILSRLAAAFSLAQAMKQAQWAEEDRQRSIQNQQREQARQDVHDMIGLNQMGAQRGDRFVEQGLDEAIGPVQNPRSVVRVAGQDYYLPSEHEQHQREMSDFADKLRTQQRVAGEDDVDIALPESVAKLMGVPRIRVPQQLVPQIADHLDNIVNPPLHPYSTTNQYGDVTPYGVNPKTMQVKRGETMFSAGKPLAQNGANPQQTARGKKNYTSRDLDTEAEAAVIAEAQKKYGQELMIEPPEVGQAIATIKRDHPEFDDAAAREYLSRVGSRLPQFKGLFSEGQAAQGRLSKIGAIPQGLLTAPAAAQKAIRLGRRPASAGQPWAGRADATSGHHAGQCERFTSGQEAGGNYRAEKGASEPMGQQVDFDFDGAFQKLQDAFRQKYGRDFTITGQGSTPMHRRLSAGRARDIRSRDLSDDEQQFIVTPIEERSAWML